MPYSWSEEFLASRTEEVIDPGLPIVDPHHHLWDARNLQPYLVPQLHDDTGAGHNVLATVFIDCVWDYRPDGPREFKPLGETARAADAARIAEEAGGAKIGGIVSHADMMLGQRAGEVLDGHLEVGKGLFRGIRHATAYVEDPAVSRTHFNPTPGMLLTEDFRAGVRELAKRDLTLDAWVYHEQLGEVADLARAVPECTIVLDHIGGPLGIGEYANKQAEVDAVWRKGLADVATCPNVTVKLGGIGMPRFGAGFEKLDVAPSSEDLVARWGEPFAYIIEKFGVERCMFESNFPVDRESTNYVILWNAFKKMVADASASEKAALFEQTARRVYKVA
ncbi:amidohydrolase family protein [Cumulibacter soli]|uniref:amidohydrolase family protein n=1 Tax=Cumulibacter soli TaxID=2546344 RepID=UPI0010676EC5|nr:amidohydrolase family protein [Cumulibacter soli]